MEKAPQVEITTSYEDWEMIRECFVDSFRHYPLYKYMVPNGEIRNQFLRKYFEANYEVTVAAGKAILLAIKAPYDVEKNEELIVKRPSEKMKIIGGVMFLLPSADGNGGWMAKDQAPYDKAYLRHELHKISSEGLTRLKRYENWENDLLEQPVRSCRLPMWNAIFCAISPEYTNLGICSMLYESAISIMANYWIASPELRLCTADEKSSLKQRLSHVIELPVNKSCDFSEFNFTAGIDKSASAPLVLAISHSERSAKFHKSNGFFSIKLIPYHDVIDDVTPFSVHILAHEPFLTGNLRQFDAAVHHTMTPSAIYKTGL